MRKKILSLAMVLFFALLISVAPTNAPVDLAEGEYIPNPQEMTVATVDMPYTVDPAAEYDTASGALIMNVYDTLIGFHYENTAAFTPRLAEGWAIVTPLLGYAMRIEFTMRAGGVKWHDGTVSDAADLARHAEYTFERWLFSDRSGGPTWMFYESLFGPGTYRVTDLTDPVTEIPNAIDRSGAVLGLNFKTNYPLTIIYQILAQPWASVINKDWAVAHGAWDGVPANWETYYDPVASPFDSPDYIMMGTGPFWLDFFDYLSEEWRIVRFPDYWEGWPAPGCFGYVDSVHKITVYEWADRKPLFLSNNPAAQVDLAYVPRAKINDPDLLAAVTAHEVVLFKDLPSLMVDAFSFNFAIPSNSPYAGDGSFGWGTSVPQNFFADAHARYGFAYAFDYNTYLTQVFLGEASQPATFMIEGLGMDDLYASLNPSLKYNFDMNAAKAELQQAHGGALWANGFTFTIPYLRGNTAAKAASNMIRDNIMSLNTQRPGLPPFQIDVRSVPWGTYLYDIVNYPIFKAKMPVFISSKLPDYPDPHNLAFPFFHSNGDYSFFQSYSNPTVDALIESEITETNQNIRKQTFGTLMTMWKTELPSVPIAQDPTRSYQRRWVLGWYYNPIQPGQPIFAWFRRMWKAPGGGADVSGDGWVDIWDASLNSAWWYAGPQGPFGPLAMQWGYNRVYDIYPKLPDGRINILDQAWINFNWNPWH